MSKCCENCFNDAYLKIKISALGIIGSCDYCNSADIQTISTQDLESLFKPFLDLYIPSSNSGIPLHERLELDWQIFGKIDVNHRLRLLNNIFSDDSYENNLVNSNVIFGDKKITNLKDTFDESKKIWEEFSEELIFQNRFFLKNENVMKIMQLLLHDGLQINMKKGVHFHRARITGDKSPLPIDKMGKPPQGKSLNGRANPIGISYLYVASELETAIAEVRPSLIDKVTVGKFVSIENLNMIDLRNISPFQFGDELGDNYKYIGFMKNMSKELSRVIHPSKINLEYLPTQYLCEFIKINSFDGIVYESSMAIGYNIVIFSDNKISCLETDAYEVTDVKYEHKLI